MECTDNLEDAGHHLGFVCLQRSTADYVECTMRAEMADNQSEAGNSLVRAIFPF